MPAQFDPTDIGTLVVQYPDRFVVSVPACPYDLAEAALEDLAAHRSHIVTNLHGHPHLLDGLSYRAGFWQPGDYTPPGST